MAGINTKKVAIAGLASGLVMNVIDFIVNGFLLKDQWAAAMKTLGLGDMTENMSAVAVFLLSDFVMGLVLAFLYAAIRPRFGAGFKTALIVAATLWVTALTIFWSFQANGVLPMSLLVTTMGASIVTVVAGSYVAGRLYSE